MAQKFYAVRRGRRPGIYRTWPETQQQVNGFTGAQYKSFPTEAAAKAFMQGKSTPTTGRRPVRSSAPAQPTTPATITVYTDGGSRNTGNVAGGHVRAGDKAAWAYRIELPADQVMTDSAGEWGASNNRMEIMAFLRALQALQRRGVNDQSIQFVLDSRYVLNAITQGWLAGWKRRGWKRSAGPLANAELWADVDRLLGAFPHLSFNWTKGHATNQGNVFVDHLLNQTMDAMVAGHPAPTAQAPRATPATKSQPAAHPKPARADQPASRETVDRSVAAIRQILHDAGLPDDAPQSKD
ncbi:ribonuclease H family protein [Levilactobacillus spicheri]|uniref:ribonuclease H n=1 Tax=Levilactobacillus spicheri TaxID=216463 RepID=A0ABQ0WNG4_9LACO|nr:ribonuclease H family protein [Levilactobacillus spicheri]GEO66563.1 ribonuclease H [Levilactobacillus spicheri]